MQAVTDWRQRAAVMLVTAMAVVGCSSTQQTQAINAPPSIDAPAQMNVLDYLHPELKPLLTSRQQLVDMLGFDSFSPENLMTFRQKDQSKPYRPLASPAVSELTIAGLAGEPEVPIFLINAGNADSAKRPAIVYLHGGGYILGTAKDSVVAMQKVAEEHDCVVVVVEYRLAPETPFPGALHDNYAALQWLYANADALGVNPQQLVIMGQSAGGGHAAMLAIAARDKGEIPVKAQILVYPMLDDRTGSSVQLPPWFGAFLWTPESNRFGWSALLGQPAGSVSVPYGAVPARIENLSGLAPAYIQVGSIDLFAPEDITYAQRLVEAGVPTELNVLPGLFHAAEHVFSDTQVSKQFKQQLDAAIGRALRE